MIKTTDNITAKEIKYVRSDRLSLCDSAINLISNINHLRRPDDIGSEYELTAQEAEAYNAALKLLTYQFSSGPSYGSLICTEKPIEEIA